MVHDSRTTQYVKTLNESEDEPLRAARARSEENDITTVSGEVGSFLRFIARAVKARSIAEIGSGGGYSGMWMLGGMDSKGILTTIEMDSDNKNYAMQAYAEGGYASRVRALLGSAQDMLPKLADNAYDIVFIDADPLHYDEYLEHARRLLKEGGLLIANNALNGHKAQDYAQNDEVTDAIRAFNDLVAEDQDFYSQLLPIGDGLLVAVWKQPNAS